MTRINDCCFSKIVADAFDRAHSMEWCNLCTASAHGNRRIGIRADHCDQFDFSTIQRKYISLILQQDDALTFRFKSHFPPWLVVAWNLKVLRRMVGPTEAKLFAQYAAHLVVDRCFRYLAFLDQRDESFTIQKLP